MRVCLPGSAGVRQYVRVVNRSGSDRATIITKISRLTRVDCDDDEVAHTLSYGDVDGCIGC